MSRDCKSCGNSRSGEYNRDVPVLVWMCRECQGDTSMPGRRVSLWYPRGSIRVLDEQDEDYESLD